MAATPNPAETESPREPDKMSFENCQALDPRGWAPAFGGAVCGHICSWDAVCDHTRKKSVVNQRERIPRPARMVCFLFFLDYA